MYCKYLLTEFNLDQAKYQLSSIIIINDPISTHLLFDGRYRHHSNCCHHYHRCHQYCRRRHHCHRSHRRPLDQTDLSRILRSQCSSIPPVTIQFKQSNTHLFSLGTYCCIPLVVIVNRTFLIYIHGSIS